MRDTDLPTTVAHIGGMMERDELLTALSTVPILRSDVDHLERTLVAKLRKSGHSWSAIAGALGVTRQSAHERFADTA